MHGCSVGELLRNHRGRGEERGTGGARAFVLLGSVGSRESSEATEWCHRTLDFARECGVRHVAVIPLRSGNGAVEHFLRHGQAYIPTASELEAIVESEIGRSEMVVTADLWDWPKLVGHCDACRESRRQRIEMINLTQEVTDPIACDCEDS